MEKGKTNWKSNPAVVNIKEWVEIQLPAQGKPGHKDDEKGQIISYDATVLDWAWDGNKAMSEKESTIEKIQNTIRLPTPGERRPFCLSQGPERYHGRI